MASPEWIAQFNRNQDIIARVNNSRDSRYDLDLVVPDLKGRTVIASCGHICREEELVRDWCPKCVHDPECDKE